MTVQWKGSRQHGDRCDNGVTGHGVRQVGPGDGQHERAVLWGGKRQACRQQWANLDERVMKPAVMSGG